MQEKSICILLHCIKLFAYAGYFHCTLCICKKAAFMCNYITLCPLHEDIAYANYTNNDGQTDRQWTKVASLKYFEQTN